MQRALVLARATVGLASPNPTVGCVLVKNGVIIGEGAHRYDEKNHAEIVALNQSGRAAAQGATAYVTLEPCNHTGRTGPCSEALAVFGIKRAVIATLDPNPLVSGNGVARLREAGVEITIGVCEAEARQLNDAFAKFIQTKTPFVTLKSALSADGRLAPPATARKTREPHWLTGPAARAQVQRLRHASDAILTGIGTILSDNPAMTDRTGLPRRRPLLRIVVDTMLSTPMDSQLVNSANNDVLLLHAADADQTRKRAFTERGLQTARIHRSDTGGLHLPTIFELLAERDILSVLAETGPRLNGSLLSAGLVDQAVLFYAPVTLGPDALPFAEDIASPQAFEKSLQQVTRTSFGDDTCVTGYLHNPWA
jgi:diaminohydroxyphosphoribosylaminopyrimidine deaminase/5-amino-6-(5-phosphoribosylamino)uracil reductase